MRCLGTTLLLLGAVASATAMVIAPAALHRLGRAQADGGPLAFHDVVSGSNGFDVGPGHDLATGWGTPNGAVLFDAYMAP